MNSFSYEKSIRLCTQAYENIYNLEAQMPMNMSDFVEISLVTHGGGIHKILNEAFECTAGDMYILSSGIQHGYFAAETGEKPIVRTLSFKPSELIESRTADMGSADFCYGVFRDKIPVSYAMLNSKAMNEVQDIFDSVEVELKEKKFEWQSAVRAHITMLLVKISRYVGMADTVKGKQSADWITVSAAIKEIIKRCGDSNMTLQSISEKLFVSKSHLSRIFKNVTGESFMNYVRGIRLNLACNLLRTTNLTNNEIVTRCGLKDVPTFYKLFKTHMGVTPYQYRMTQQTYNKGENVMSICLEISENLQKGKAKAVTALVQQAIDEGVPAVQILNEGLLSGMNVIGQKFKNGEVYVPEVLVAARAMNMGSQILKPLLVDEGIKSSGKVCIGTVQGDLHDIGKNLVKMMLEGKGLEVVDLGTDVPPEAFVQAAVEQNCQIICCSALLTTTMDVMADVVKRAEEAGIRDKVKIMVGGAPVTEEFCRKIGADKYTSDAASAAEAAVELLN